MELRKTAIMSAMHIPLYNNYATLLTVCSGRQCNVDFIVQIMNKTQC